MKLYKIRAWDCLYENNRTRELKKLDWVPIPNKQDGDGYTIMVSGKDGAAIFGAWIACIQIASRCDPRGTLMRDCNKPHDSASLSRMSRIPVDVFEKMLIVASSADVGWLEVSECGHLTDNPAPSCGNPAVECLEGKGREVKELNGKNGTYPPESRVALFFLNEQSGRSFRETADNLGFITARLKEPGVDIEGVKKMILRQCSLWKGTSQAEYLRPQTLFNATKFDAYYAAKDVPIQTSLPMQKPESKQIQETINVPTL